MSITDKIVCRGAEIKVIKGDLADATQPHISVNPDSTGQKANYYQIATLPLKIMVDGVMTRPGKPRIFNIFENGNRASEFKEIEEALSDPKNYTLLNSGDIIIDRLSYGLSGTAITEECGFHYTMTDTKTGKPIMDSNTGLPRLRHTITVYLLRHEIESGDAESIIAAEIRRAKKTEVITEEEKEADDSTAK
jgi:hypothetical protein